MAKRGAGHLVFISSIAGLTGARHEAAYAGRQGGPAHASPRAWPTSWTARTSASPWWCPAWSTRRSSTTAAGPTARSAPAPIPAERVARAVLTAVRHDRELVFVPRWMRFPAWLHGTAPRTFRVLASRFG